MLHRHFDEFPQLPPQLQRHATADDALRVASTHDLLDQIGAHRDDRLHIFCRVAEFDLHLGHGSNSRSRRGDARDGMDRAIVWALGTSRCSAVFTAAVRGSGDEESYGAVSVDP